jgi:hypothetical protein
MPVGSPVVAAKIPPGFPADLSPSPDGKRFLMLERVRPAGSQPEIRVVLNWTEELEEKLRQAHAISRLRALRAMPTALPGSHAKRRRSLR